MGKIDATLALLRQAAEKHDSVCVAYSGGKDSMTVMDLCTRTFKRVEAFYMYVVPGLQSEEAKLAYCKEKFGVTVRQMPHWASIRSLLSWAYVDPQPAIDLLPEWTLRDCYQRMMDDTGCPYVAVGAKKADSSWRRRFMKGTEDWTFMLNPIADWNKFDVLGYLAAQGIKIPQARQGKTATGLDLSMASLRHLYDTHPDDFDRLCQFFPYARAAIAHREFFGEGAPQ
jgi:phosphoadenosine phosphosulfate reductase